MKKHLYVALLLAIALTICPEALYSQSAVNYPELIKLKKGYKIYPYKNTSKIKLQTFTVMDPGLCIIPLNFGLYACGLSTWLAKPNRSSPILASSFLLTPGDTSMLLMRLDLERKKIRIQKTKMVDEPDSGAILFSMPINKYDLLAVNEKMFFIWGNFSGGSALWRSDYKTVETVFYGASEIADMAYVTNDKYLLAVDSSIVAVGLNKAPQELMKFDLPVESITIDPYSSGAVYVSTRAGVVRINSLDQDDVDVITEAIHGKLRVYQNKLFILWDNQNQIVEIALK